MKLGKYLQIIIISNFLALLTINVKSVQANPLKCYQQALPTFANSYMADLVTWMCQGAIDTMPAQCFRAALPTFYNDQVAKRATMVCKQAKSIAPGQCFIQAIGTFYNSASVERGFKLCNPNETALNNNPDSTNIYGAWAVKSGKWNGILRMRGNYGSMVLVSGTGAVVEQKMTLNVNPEGGYILNGEVLTKYLNGEYNADNFYIERFSEDSFSVKNCDNSGQCYSASLVYLGK